MSTTYGGYGVDSSGAVTATTGNGQVNGSEDDVAQVTFNAPASGNWVDLSAYSNYLFGGQPSIRLAVYRASDGRLEAQGNAAVPVAFNVQQFNGHLTSADITQSHAAVSGTAYVLAISAVGGVAIVSYDTAGSFGDFLGGTTDYATGGWPDPAPTVSSNQFRLILRAGIQPGGPPPSVVVPINLLMQQQGWGQP